MIIKSDWHIHSEASYDASNPLSTIVENAKKQGLEHIGITDHLNFNDNKFIGDLKNSVKSVKEMQKGNPFLVLGVELTPVELPEYEYIKGNGGSREGYVPPVQDKPYGIELGMSREELMSLGVRYAIGAAHWRVDVPNGRALKTDLDASIRDWYRQQMWLACDDRVTILGHPWYNGIGLWYQDFSVIPHSMNLDIAAALKENKKHVECNSQFFYSKYSTEKFRHQYAEFLRELFEMGIPLTYGSDAHHEYSDLREKIEGYLSAAGFVEGDIVGLSENDLWS